MTTLDIQTISLIYPTGLKALDNITLRVTSGLFGLLGPNGAGKSSLLKSLAGLLKPQAGSILLNQVDIIQTPEFIKKQLGFLPQDFGVYPKATAVELLNHLAKLKGVRDARARKNQIMDLLEKVNLSAHRHQYVANYSGGMRQRFGVAQALLGQPRIIIVDEPTAGLDPEEKQRFYFLLNEIAENVLVILSTHLVEDVQQLCTDLAIINKGKIVAHGQPYALIHALKGKLWQALINKSDLSMVLEAQDVIALRAAQHNHVEVTVRADSPPRGFSSVTPNLEHVYFNYLKK